MALSVAISGDHESLLGLERRIREDPNLRGSRLRRVEAPPATGEMGFVAEALQWTTDNNELLAGLAGVVAGWLARPQNRSRITVQVGDQKIEVESDKVTDPEAAARELLNRLQESR